MDIILYLLIFCIGTVFGSFFTLAVYRIPLHQDITHTRSYCPNCNHKLGFWDMIPVLSYVCLGGKCRYCDKQIRPRYLLLEVLSGVVFVLFAVSIKLSMYTLSIPVMTYFIMGLLYIASLFIIAGIDKENIKIAKPVLLFGFICITAYIIYLYIVENDPNIYRYVIYWVLIAILLGINTIYLRKKTKDSYPIDILLLSIFMAMFTFEICYICTAVITLMAVAIQLLIHKWKHREKKHVKKEKKDLSAIPFGFYLCTANIIVMIVTNFYVLYRW